jgi:hypothetical protein
LYNFFLSTLLSNHATTAKAAVRGGRATVGQAAKGRRQGGQAGGQKCRRRVGGREATWWSNSGCGWGNGARAKRRSNLDSGGERSGGACGGAGVGQGVWLSRTGNTCQAEARVRFSLLVGVLGRAKVWLTPYCATLGPSSMLDDPKKSP